MKVLVVDVGGTHVKILATGQDEHRQFESGPTLTPQRMASQARRLSHDWKYNAVSIGYPGPVLHGRPISEPFNLGTGWVGFNFEAAFKAPVKVVNDAAMQALGSYKGGKMLFLGLGTGLGSTMIVEGIVEPMELGHLPYKRATFEDYIGIRGLKKYGIKKWRLYLADVVKRLIAALEPDEVVLGGGNVNKLEKLPAGSHAGDNANAFRGGFRLWEKSSRRKLSTVARIGMGATLALILCVGTVRGQEIESLQSANTTTNHSSGTNNNEMNKEAPDVSVNLRPFVPILPRDHLFGDWYGLRHELEQLGITPTVTYVSDVAGNPTGGKSQGITHSDNIGMDLLFDLDKLMGLKGGSFEISTSYRYGNSLSQDRVGNIFTVQQDYGGDTFKLVDAAYRQKFWDDRIDVRVGRIATGDDFLVSPADYLFMQNAFDGNPVGIFKNSPGMTAYPNATWGGLIDIKPTKRTYIMGGVYNGNPAIRDIDHNGVDMSFNGPVFAIVEGGYHPNSLPGDARYLGDYKLGSWYDNASFADYKTEGYETPSGMKRGNWGLYAMFDQVVFPFGDPAQNSGVVAFGAFLASPDQSVSQLPYYADGGVLCRGMFPSRPRDVAGFGMIYGDFSSDLRHAEEREEVLAPALGVQDYETVLEWTYKFYSRNGSVFIQPDAQYIIRPGGTGKIADALVLGGQFGVNF